MGVQNPPSTKPVGALLAGCCPRLSIYWIDGLHRQSRVKHEHSLFYLTLSNQNICFAEQNSSLLLLLCSSSCGFSPQDELGDPDSKNVLLKRQKADEVVGPDYTIADVANDLMSSAPAAHEQTREIVSTVFVVSPL